MYDSGANYEESVNYNLLFCHACLSSNRTLSAVGDYVDIYRKICDNSLMNLTSQVNICWECLALLKKVHAFRRKVENAQKILDYCVNKQVPLEDNLSDLTLSNTETTTFDYYPIFEDQNADEYENYLEKPEKETYMDKACVTEDLYELKDELMFKIENVRGRCDIIDERPMLELSTSLGGVTVKTESGSPADEEDRRHCRWKRSVLLVLKRLCGHRYAHHFLRPVSDELAPLYSAIVRRPTDLATIRRRVKDGLIRTTAELTQALLLMFSNALMYNSTCHKIYQMAVEFREETIRELSLLVAAQTETDSPLAPELRRRPTPLPRTRHQEPTSGAKPKECLSAKSEWATSVSTNARDWEGRIPASYVLKTPAARLTPAKVPQGLARRRASLWDVPLKGIDEVASDVMKTPAARRTPPTKAPQSLARRRASLWDVSLKDEIKPAVTPRPPRRASVYAREPATPAAPPAPATPAAPATPPAPAAPRRRAKWDWPGLDNDQYLVANCFKKCKSTVLL